MDKIINGKEISLKIRNELKVKVESFNHRPSLVVIQVGTDPSSTIYVNNKAKACQEVGISFKHLLLEETIEEKELINYINKLNNDINIDGVLVQLPLPKHLNEDKIINSIIPSKDVDGLTNVNLGKLISNKADLVSCTPLGILELLNEYHVSLTGKHVVIIGRSRLVGRPLSILLLNQDATVTVCHSKTPDISLYTKQADILIVAVGKRALITAEMVKEGSIIIDVGINVVGGKLYGDVDYDHVIAKASLITPVPGGVGPMTVAMLLSNVIKSYEKKMN